MIDHVRKWDISGRGILMFKFSSEMEQTLHFLQTDPNEAEKKMKKNIKFFTVHLVAGASFDNTF